MTIFLLAVATTAHGTGRRRGTDTHAHFVYLPVRGQLWKEVFGGTGPRVRTYPDGRIRITVGNRQSTQAVLGAIAVALTPETP